MRRPAPRSIGALRSRPKPGSQRLQPPFALGRSENPPGTLYRMEISFDTKEAAMPSFDIVSRIELAEVDNALAAIMREIGTRFDFKGSKCKVERQEGVLNVIADDELKLKQMHELLKVHMTRRKVDPAALDYKTPEKASGNTLRQTIVLRQGVDADLARQLIREIKDSKLKVQVSIQGDELRVTGKKRDDLQGAIAVLRTVKNEQPLQYINFRE